MEPYQQIFPKAQEPNLTVALSRKVGRIPKGSYTFFECYCTDPDCDCRRTTLLVINEKSQQKAAICFGFEPEEPMAGPFLDDFQKQAPYADELLELFVDAINGSPDWLARMYQQYRDVRQKVAGKPYRGKPFVNPGLVKRRVKAPPELDAETEDMLKALASSVRSASDPRSKKRGKPDHPDLFSPPPPSPGKSAPAAKKGMAAFLEQYLLMLGHGSDYPDHPSTPLRDRDALQDELRHHLLADDQASDALAQVIAAASQGEMRDEAVLRLLLDSLEILRVELERNRPGSRRRMESLQSALAARVFIEQEDEELCASVTHTLLQSRVEILPVLHEAYERRMEEAAGRSGLPELSGEEVAEGLCRSIEEMGLASPFEGMEAMLQFFALGGAGFQTALCGTMLSVRNPFIRDIAPLMLFHPAAEVRQGVAELLAGCDGGTLTPESLRRLIVSRNWFPQEIRKFLDQAISNARKARVECAPFPGPASMKVLASVVDGAGAQSFQVIVPDGKGFCSCALLLKQGVGVADAFLVPLKTKRELNDFLAMMKREVSCTEITPDHLDLRVNQALAEGAHLGNVPNFWLVRIAELLGRDQWRSVPFDALDTLAQLRKELSSASPKLLSDRERANALEESADWPATEDFAVSWFEDDAALDREVETSQGKKKTPDARAAVGRILDVVLEGRRAVWLERLLLSALWLKSSSKPPLPWHLMFHVTEAVADQRLPMREIPLMLSIAEQSYRACLGRLERPRG